MDETRRLERRRQAALAYGYAVPAALLAIAAWAGWGSRDYDTIRDALQIWPAVALIAGILSVGLGRSQTNRRAPILTAPGPLVLFGGICWLVGWEQPVAGIYMSAALVGWIVAATMLRGPGTAAR